MTTLIAIFVRVILPIAVIVILGYVAGRTLHLEQRSLSRLGLYVLVPCMVFTAMSRTTLSAGEFGQIILFLVLITLALWPLSILTARLLRLDARSSNAFHLGTLLTNVVNVGFPVLTLAYGPAALERGLVYMVGMQSLFQTLGIYLAAGGHISARQSLRQVFLMPGLYALAAGLAVNASGLPLPAFLYDPLKMVGDALVPLLLVLLGMQLTTVRFEGRWLAAIAATILRLVIAAGLAMLLAALMGLSGVTRQALIVEASVPSAIFGLVLAQEFDCNPQLVTAIIFVSTVASVVTLTVLLAII